VNIGITATAASTPTINQVRFLREGGGCPFELLLPFANRFSFKPPQGQLQALIYHCDGCKKKSALARDYWLDASQKPAGSISKEPTSC
jgi:hypothetical protein